MDQAHTARPRLIIGVATVLGFFSGFQAYQSVTLFGDAQTPFYTLLLLNLSFWYSWALLVPVVLWMARRFPFDGGRWTRSAPVHLVAILVLAFLHVAMTEGFFVLLPGSGYLGKMTWWHRVQRGYMLNFDWEMGIYLAIVAASYALSYQREAQDRTLRASQLEMRLAEARLQALQRQLHPHFLFNTLNAISALMHRDVDAADLMLTRLSDLLRMAMQQRTTQEIPLKDELEFLEKYLEIEQTRFGERLSVGFDVDPETLDALVPNLLLQPLVENSVRHAVAVRIAPGRIDVRSRRRGDLLELEVRDNGPGVTGGGPPAEGKGLGLSTTRERLEHLYGPRQQLRFAEPPGGGLSVTVTIPFRCEEPDGVAEKVRGVA